MNVFLPDKSVVLSVECLDDRRLIKQILEIQTLMSDGSGYANHPVKIFYRDKKLFLAYYAYICCAEYYYRFKRQHKLESIFKKYITDTGDFDVSFLWWKEGLYAAGNKNSPNCVRETDPPKVIELFRQKLITKWNNDKILPKWTKRYPPEWSNIRRTYEIQIK